MTDSAGRSSGRRADEGWADAGSDAVEPPYVAAVNGTDGTQGHGPPEPVEQHDQGQRTDQRRDRSGQWTPARSLRRESPVDEAARKSALPTDETPTGYRLRPTVGLRIVGAGCVWLCLPLVLEMLRRTVPATDVAAVAVLGWIGFAVFVVVVVGGAVLLLDRRPQLVLSAEGFRNRTSLRGGGRRTARWEEVTGVRTVETVAGPVLRIELQDGGASQVAGRVLDADLNTVELDLHQRLNSAYGYRPLS